MKISILRIRCFLLSGIFPEYHRMCGYCVYSPLCFYIVLLHKSMFPCVLVISFNTVSCMLLSVIFMRYFSITIFNFFILHKKSPSRRLSEMSVLSKKSYLALPPPLFFLVGEEGITRFRIAEVTDEGYVSFVISATKLWKCRFRTRRRDGRFRLPPVFSSTPN